MQSVKLILLSLILTSCVKKQYPETYYENIILSKTVEENAAQILFMQKIIAEQNKSIKRLK